MSGVWIAWDYFSSVFGFSYTNFWGSGFLITSFDLSSSSEESPILPENIGALDSGFGIGYGFAYADLITDAVYLGIIYGPGNFDCWGYYTYFAIS